MTLVELFGKYYNGELTNEEEIKRIFKEEVNFFSVIQSLILKFQDIVIKKIFLIN